MSVSGRRRFVLLIASLVLLAVCSMSMVLWFWKAPALVRRRLEQLTGHRVAIGGISLTYRFNLVARDVRIAGTPPFESQTLARADRVLIRLGGEGGFWSPSAVIVDGLEIEYLGTTDGDNLRGLAPLTKKIAPSDSPFANSTKTILTVRNGRLRGSVALPHGLLLAFRVPQFTFEHSSNGKAQMSLSGLVIDAEGWGAFRALALKAEYDREHLVLTSGGNVAIDIPGGGSLLEGLALTADFSRSNTTFQLQSSDALERQVKLVGHFEPQSIEVAMDVQDASLRALGALATGRVFGLENTKSSLHALLSIDRSSMRAKYDLDGKFRGLDLLHPAIDTTPWRNLNGTFTLRGYADFASGRIDIADSSLHALATTISIEGWVESARSPHGSLVLGTPRHAPLSCAALLLGQTPPVQQALAGLDLDGKLGFTVTLGFDATAWEELDLDIKFDPICTVKSEAHALAMLLPILQQPGTRIIVPTKLPLGPSHPDFTPLAIMPRHLPSAFMTSEDSKFFHHRGFDMDMIRHALAQDLQNRSFDRGASTITQQLAKNLFLSHRRTLARKLEEAVLTWRLHKLLSKDRILELYLNVIELGPGIRGVKQAARIYFGKDVTALTPIESAHLAALTPNPHVLARRFRDGQVDEGWQQRLYDLLGMMKRHGRLSPAELATARTSHLVLRDLSNEATQRGTH
jgi:hypothetical protein